MSGAKLRVLPLELPKPAVCGTPDPANAEVLLAGLRLAVDGCLTAANGYGELAAALEMVGPLAETRRVTLGADKAYDSRDFVEALRIRRTVGTPSGYQYERDVEQFFRHSPAVVREE